MQSFPSSDTSDHDTFEREREIARFLNRRGSLQRPRKPKVLQETRGGTSYRMSTIRESPLTESRFDRSVNAKHVYSPIDVRDTIEESEDEDDIWASETNLDIERRRLAEDTGAGDMEEIDLGSPCEYGYTRQSNDGTLEWRRT